MQSRRGYVSVVVMENCFIYFLFLEICFDVCLWLVPRFSNGFEYLKFRGR